MSALRLSELGSDPESVLRLVRFFDDLDATGADAVLEAAQAVAGCPVHVRWDGSAPEVWLERDAPAHPLDGVLLDRVRHALGDIGARVPPSFGDPALVEVVLSSRERPEDRARAIRLLGLDESREVRVLAVSAQSSPEALRVITSALTSVSVRTADLGTATAVVCQGRTNTRALSDELDQAIVTAFPAPLPAELPPEATRGSHALARINEIAATPAGLLQVETAEAFCVFGLLRRTAEELHVHHSTVAARLARIETQLGWDMDDPVDRFSATLVLMIRRIALSSAELTD